MSIKNGLVSAPVGLQELYTLLGIAPQNGFYDLSYLCGNTHGKINKWAKYKPIELYKPDPPTDAELLAQMYGLRLMRVSTKKLQAQDLSVSADNIRALEDYDWGLNAPTTWKRLLDFEGYYHASKPFMYYDRNNVGTDTINVNEGDATWTPTIYNNIDDDGCEHMVKVEDVNESHLFSSGEFGSEYYAALAVVKSIGDSYTIFKDSSPITDSPWPDIAVRFSKTSKIGYLTPGEYYAYPCLVRGDNLGMLPMPSPQGGGVRPWTLKCVNMVPVTISVTFYRVGAYRYASDTGYGDIRESSNETRLWQAASYYDSRYDGHPISLVNQSNCILRLRVKGAGDRATTLDLTALGLRSADGKEGNAVTQLPTETRSYTAADRRVSSSIADSVTIPAGGTQEIYMMPRTQRLLSDDTQIQVTYNGVQLANYEFASVVLA